MTDIVERLRDKHCCDNGCHCDEAADEIERLESVVEPWRNLAKLLEGDVAILRAANARLQAALEPFANALKGNWSAQSGSMKIVAGPHAHDLRLELTLYDFRRAALAQEKPHDR
jgi:hypothetical protein